ncbi:MAG TPA: hypothetical protein VIH91_01665 [Terriglobales bacterium]
MLSSELIPAAAYDIAALSLTERLRKTSLPGDTREIGDHTMDSEQIEVSQHQRTQE